VDSWSSTALGWLRALKPILDIGKYQTLKLWISTDFPLGVWHRLGDVKQYSKWQCFDIDEMVNTTWHYIATQSQVSPGPRNLPVENLLKAWSVTAMAKSVKSEVGQGSMAVFAIDDAHFRNTSAVPEFNVSIAEQRCERCGEVINSKLFHNQFQCPV
jgi:hypothetical protein